MKIKMKKTRRKKEAMESRVRMTSGRETPRCVPTRSRLSDWSGLVASCLLHGERRRPNQKKKKKKKDIERRKKK
jgi:hypothetical protein